MKRFFFCLVFAVFFLTISAQVYANEIVLTIFYEVSDNRGPEYWSSLPLAIISSISTSQTFSRSSEYRLLKLTPTSNTSDIIEIAESNILIGRTNSLLVKYPEQNKTIIKVIAYRDTIPILVPTDSNPTVSGANVENGKFVSKIEIEADPSKSYDLRFQYGYDRVNGYDRVMKEPILFLLGTQGCSILNKTERTGIINYQIIPSQCESLSLFPLNNPLPFDFNTLQISGDRLIIGQPNTVYSLPLPPDKSPRLIAKAAYYQRLTGKQYGDFNEDGSYGYKDLQAVGSKFGQKGNFILEDINDDGIVNILDMVVMAQNLSKTAAAPPNYFKSSYTATIWGNLKK